MTCLFCSYEFCWACGGSATLPDRHYTFGRGCGVKFFDDTVRPGDHLAELELRFSDEIFKPLYVFSVFIIFHRMRFPSCKSIMIFFLFFLLAPLITLVLIPSGFVRKAWNCTTPIFCKIIISVFLLAISLPIWAIVVCLFYVACAFHFVLALLRIVCYVLCCPCVDNEDRNIAKARHNID